MRQMSKYISTIILLIISTLAFAQPVPNTEENIPYLMTFGPRAETSWGDDDFSQTFFFLVPKDYDQPFFIRVFDPDTGGEVDEIAGEFDTRQVYEIYGGETAWTDVDARETSPVGNYKSGTLLASRAFAQNPRYDNSWYSFGPFNPAQGEYDEMFDGGRIFKVICEGVTGDDGNMYRFFLSTDANDNRPIEGANAFAYEYSFRMHNSTDEVAHIYPFVELNTKTVKISNFDWDNDGSIVVISVARPGSKVAISKEDHWAFDELLVQDEEEGTTFDFRFVKAIPLVKNNNVVVNVRNQFDEALPFYTIPIGGVPEYAGDVGMEAIEE